MTRRRRANVLICASQIKRLFGSEDIEKVMDYKIERGRKIVDQYLSIHSKEIE